MKKVKILTTSLLTSLVLPTVAFADSGSGVDAILKTESFEGNSSISNTVAGYLNYPISFIITMAGFLIITLTFTRFVFGLLYYSFPALFNNIHEWRTQAKDKGKGESAKDYLTYFATMILPDIKALANVTEDNEDNTLKEFLQANALKVVIFIIVGSTIYDGTARNLIAKGADIGLFFTSIVDKHDTVGMIHNFVNASDEYVYPYNSATQEGKNRLEIARRVATSLNGLNPGVKSDAHSLAIGKVTEQIVAKIEEDMVIMYNSMNGNNSTSATVGDDKGPFSKIVNFSLTVTPTQVQPNSNIMHGTHVKGSGVFVIKLEGLSGVDKEAKEVLLTSPKKYIKIQYSKVVDETNRNIFYKKPDTSN